MRIEYAAMFTRHDEAQRDDLVPLPEAAALLGVPESLLRARIQSGQLVAIETRGAFHLPRAALQIRRDR